MKLKNVIACLAVLAFVSGSTCAMAKNVDNQQKNAKKAPSEHQGIQRTDLYFLPYGKNKKNVDNQQKVEKQVKVEKKNNAKKTPSKHQGIQRRKSYVPFD